MTRLHTDSITVHHTNNNCLYPLENVFGANRLIFAYAERSRQGLILVSWNSKSWPVSPRVERKRAIIDDLSCFGVDGIEHSNLYSLVICTAKLRVSLQSLSLQRYLYTLRYHFLPVSCSLSRRIVCIAPGLPKGEQRNWKVNILSIFDFQFLRHFHWRTLSCNTRGGPVL